MRQHRLRRAASNPAPWRSQRDRLDFYHGLLDMDWSERERLIRQKFESTAVNRFLGFELAELGDGEAVLTMEPRPEYRQEGGVIQGGISSALADTSTAYALATQLPPNRSMTGIEYKINFLRPGQLDRGTLIARARVVRQGRRIAVCATEVAQGDRPIATGTFTYLLFAAQGSQ